MKITTLVFVIIFTGLFTQAQNQPKTLLWKVTKKGNKHESYLFGTFHEVSPLFFNTLSNAVDKLHQSDILLVEQRNSSQGNFTFKDSWTHEKWEKILSPEQEEVFTSFITKAEDTSYYKLNPLLLSLTMARLYLINFCETDSSFNELMDNYIEGLAIKENKIIYSLDFNQINILDETSTKITPTQDSLYSAFGIKYMKNMLDNNMADCRIINDYKNLNIDYQLENEISETSTDFELLISRNNSWTSKLESYFSKNNCFVAIGFRHLFYKQGLIQKFKNLGYDVIPIPVRL